MDPLRDGRRERTILRTDHDERGYRELREPRQKGVATHQGLESEEKGRDVE